MLKTNSKDAKRNIRNYILAGFEPYDLAEFDRLREEYEAINPKGDNFEAVAHYILQVFRSELFNGNLVRHYHGVQHFAFLDWVAGLPSVIDTCYHYNRSAVEDVADILEETADEANKYSEEQAEKLLDWLIYRELVSAENKYNKAVN